MKGFYFSVFHWLYSSTTNFLPEFKHYSFADLYYNHRFEMNLVRKPARRLWNLWQPSPTGRTAGHGGRAHLPYIFWMPCRSSPGSRKLSVSMYW